MKKPLGIFFIVVGLLILITPFTPGSILLIIGIDMVFGNRWPWWKKTKNDLRKFWRGFLK
ncbi:MAG: hypothetical protein A3I26_02110 [Candidatus Yanofskybacteria bacterium RIFCSPLOWO2_02_FULL_43_10]|uniref:Uncharacterized protein n=1 Tax=Candidatus Yanofskybacteria bacterium RIFCSPLOWO2_12_FULL_43_11b TaxID=1802710 RepID=A0A1F8H8T1_9BACT|nr:MAG: hypothetical protein A2742_02435 [Candidatus Yanofskybacteria bacterium RIFCSPHIGHO2_01_FULL_43_32]OGN11549.1 MAG: hypothetical protein A3C69_03775 [Candidatus Yanofskybacteria bacterium RIFCSPHIGHO2_02_FULL_43_12]OGN17434.1 MAG: hypothetical protein A3E34_01725 [Candidatus Yanofskybacteria bacterium RIFCSPHIGHO2_12_FULL_43_11]OGN24886.1 MAG: hypothetical protein A2923_01255 [Candidatus Yanofskybacteria bacterium RIFCSPLOWO2_01_FULL_43_46]OGN30264.1 MAG: hypothetical protein A3I26_02110